ncbi:MAG: class I SAM-dependent methyltransferase [Paludibacter sp.]|nr:class I SAM-dependent methyltransferase [Paludibacter sp.]
MDLTGERYMPQMKGIIELEHLNRYYFVVNQLDLSDKIVVDLASGEGYGSNILSEYALKVIGIDINNQAVEHANSVYSKENLKFIQGDAAKIPLKENSADVFVSFETIEHHDKHEQMLTEIKRVLKPDGILVMSSPDKYYYTDLPDYHNQFHVKELYYDEFKLLIAKYFKYNAFYSQSVFSGSIITADTEIVLNKKPVLTRFNKQTNPFTPIYNIAISTDSEGYQPELLHVLYGETENVLTDEDIYKAQQKIRSSVEYRLGRKILKRFAFLRKFIK